MRVLVVDDTKNIRLLLMKCLELEGYQVSTACDGAAAIEALTGRRFDLVFLDVRMPRLSGTEVLRRMREMGLKTPVIMITAFSTIKNAVDCTRMGAVAYLQKPFTENKIKQVLQEILSLDSTMSGIENTLAVARDYLTRGSFGEAESMLRAVLSDCFTEPRIYGLLAQAYDGLKKPEEAEKCRKMAAALQSK